MTNPKPIRTKEDFAHVLNSDKILRLELVSNFQRTVVLDALWPYIKAAIDKAKIESAVDAGNAEYQRASKLGWDKAIDEAMKIVTDKTGIQTKSQWIELLKKLKKLKHGGETCLR